MDYREHSKKSSEVSFDSEWVRKIKTGDPGAFEDLFNKYCQPLINFARRMVQDTPTAENIVQDVFLKVWTNRAELNPDLNIKTYLFTAVKNTALGQIRHLNVVQKSEEKIMSAAPRVKTPEDEWSDKEIAEAINSAITALPEKCRLVFCMNRFDQLTYAQIAEVQNISIKTVETQMGRALKYLRQRLSFLLK